MEFVCAKYPTEVYDTTFSMISGEDTGAADDPDYEDVSDDSSDEEDEDEDEDEGDICDDPNGPWPHAKKRGYLLAVEEEGREGVRACASRLLGEDFTSFSDLPHEAVKRGVSQSSRKKSSRT